MDFIEDHWGVITIIIVAIVAICVIVENIECEKNGGTIVGGYKSPTYCIKKDAIISD